MKISLKKDKNEKWTKWCLGKMRKILLYFKKTNSRKADYVAVVVSAT